MNDIPVPVEPVEFCVVKRNAISLYSLRERLFFQKATISMIQPNGLRAELGPCRRFRSLQGASSLDAQESTCVSLIRSTTT